MVRNSHGGLPGKGRLGLAFGYFTHGVEEQIALLKEVCFSTYRISSLRSFILSFTMSFLYKNDQYLDGMKKGRWVCLQTLGSPSYASLVPDSSRTPLDEAKIAEKGPLRIGYFTYDGFLHPVPS